MNKYIYCIIILFTVSCSKSPSIYVQSGYPSIRNKIKNAIENSGLITNIGIKVVSLSSGVVLYELNPNSLFNPASNNKLYTSLAAINLLDTTYSFKTEVYHHQQSIYLVGGGDPDLSLSELNSLADLTANRISYATHLYLDDSRLDSIKFGAGWMWDEGAWWYAAQVSALSVNDNCVDFIISPGPIGQPANIKMNPMSEYYQVANQSQTVNDTTDFIKLKIDRDWENQSNYFSIFGNILNTSTIDTFYRNVHDPTMYTGTIFKEILSKKGLVVEHMQKKNIPVTAELIASHISKPLSYSLKNLMEKSDNLTAELLIKTIGFESTGERGNWQNGLLAVKSMLYDDVGIDTSGISIKDGSGVSRYNYSSPNHFIQLLTWAYKNQDVRGKLLKILPMRKAVGFPRNSEEINQIYAKTGSLAGVSTLSGYIFTQSGEPLAFSILMNGYTGSSKKYFGLKDQIVRILLANL